MAAPIIAAFSYTAKGSSRERTLPADRVAHLPLAGFRRYSACNPDTLRIVPLCCIE